MIIYVASLESNWELPSYLGEPVLFLGTVISFNLLALLTAPYEKLQRTDKKVKAHFRRWYKWLFWGVSVLMNGGLLMYFEELRQEHVYYGEWEYAVGDNIAVALTAAFFIGSVGTFLYWRKMTKRYVKDANYADLDILDMPE